MAVAYLGGQGTGAGSGTSLSCARPAAAVTGCCLVMGVYLENAAVTLAAPAGWTLVQTIREDSSQLVVWARIDDGSAGPFAITWGGATAYRDGWVHALSGADATTPVNASSGQSQRASRSMTAPSLTSSVANCALVFLGAPNGAPGGVTPPSGFTERAERAGMYAADLLDMGAAGASGAKTATLGNAIDSCAVLVAVAPVSTVTTVSVGRVSESDTARALAPAKVLGVGRAGESDAARTLAIGKTVALRRAVDSGLARAVALSKTAMIGRAASIDTGRALIIGKTVSVGRAGEVGAARGLTVSIDLRPTDLPTAVTIAPTASTTLPQTLASTVTLEVPQTFTTLDAGAREVTLDG